MHKLTSQEGKGERTNITAIVVLNLGPMPQVCGIHPSVLQADPFASSIIHIRHSPCTIIIIIIITIILDIYPC
jgi:hypothetical protein